MPFGMVSGVGRRMGVLDGMVIVEGDGTVLGVNLGLWGGIVSTCDRLFLCQHGVTVFVLAQCDR